MRMIRQRSYVLLSMHTIVISLADSTERRASIQSQLDPLGVTYEFCDAVRGESGLEQFDQFNERLHLLNTGRRASPGEIGCFASHVNVWERCVELGKPVVVLEDDAGINRNYPDALAFIGQAISELGFVRLQPDGPRQAGKKVLIGSHDAFNCYYYERYPFGAMGYAISPAAASRFISHSRVLTGPVDLFIKQFWIHGQPLYGITPFPVQASAFCDVTTIADRKHWVRRPISRARRAIYKLRCHMQRDRFNREQRARQHAPLPWQL